MRGIGAAAGAEVSRTGAKSRGIVGFGAGAGAELRGTGAKLTGVAGLGAGLFCWPWDVGGGDRMVYMMLSMRFRMCLLFSPLSSCEVGLGWISSWASTSSPSS